MYTAPKTKLHFVVTQAAAAMIGRLGCYAFLPVATETLYMGTYFY